MKRVVALIVLLGLTLAVSATAAPKYVAGEVLVKFKFEFRRDRAVMATFYNAIGAEKIFRFTGSMDGYERISFSKQSVLQAVEILSQNPAVEYAQPNFILRTQPVVEAETTTKPRSGGLWPTNPVPYPTNPPRRPPVQDAPAEVEPPVADPKISELYGMKIIGADSDVWTKQTGKAVIVADIDTGIDYNHEDLAFNLWRNPTPTNGDVVGYDFVHNDGMPFDDNLHGSHTAGTIAAVGGNGVGVVGVAPRATIMALKFLSAEGSGTTADAVRAIDYAIDHGAKVLSNSWGGPEDEENRMIYDAIERAKLKDVLFIASAGNGDMRGNGIDMDKGAKSYPAAFDNENLITVAATDKSDHLAKFSNYGKKTVHLAAPGVKILSASPGNRYRELSGTSMACPHVSGAAAMVWANHPSWNFKQVKDAILASVDALPQLANRTISGGRLNLKKALEQ